MQIFVKTLTGKTSMYSQPTSLNMPRPMKASWLVVTVSNMRRQSLLRSSPATQSIMSRARSRTRKAFPRTSSASFLLASSSKTAGPFRTTTSRRSLPCTLVCTLQAIALHLNSFLFVSTPPSWRNADLCEDAHREDQYVVKFICPGFSAASDIPHQLPSRSNPVTQSTTSRARFRTRKVSLPISSASFSLVNSSRMVAPSQIITFRRRAPSISCSVFVVGASW